MSKLEALEPEFQVFQAKTEQVSHTPVRLHPQLAEHYAKMVASLHNHLNNPNYKDEAVTVLRGLIDQRTVHPSKVRGFNRYHGKSCIYANSFR
jgi:hypothetical protein